MQALRWTVYLLFGAVVTAASVGGAIAAEPTEEAGQGKPTAAKRPELKFVDVNLEEKYVDLEARICLTAGMLELAVTVAHGKEHESVAAVKARPQHVHLALLMLGLESGQPGRWEYNDGEPKPIPPTGDPVRVSLVIEDEDGEKVEKSISDFIRRAGTEDHLPGDVFLFAGSKVAKPADADPYYVADMTGELIALVSFDGETLAWPRAASQSNEALVWVVDEEAVPELGTEVVVRLRPVEDWEGPGELPDHTEIEPAGESDSEGEGEEAETKGKVSPTP